MTDIRIIYDPQTKKIVVPVAGIPRFQDFIRRIPGTNLVTIPQRLFNLETGQFVTVQVSAKVKKKGT